MKSKSEGNVYKVRWKKTPPGYSAWLSCVPKLKVNGKDQEELSELLFEITMDRFGDVNPALILIPRSRQNLQNRVTSSRNGLYCSQTNILERLGMGHLFSLRVYAPTAVRLRDKELLNLAF